ncbi:MAG: hypothetical protein HYW22_01330 [Candidatus Aenigmarchaeota archaeon]|nr:hypothetical protein [Candidatus Aenigmarchaeota archaeon]
MYEASLKLKCTRPDAVRKSLEPDIKNDENTDTQMSVDGEFLLINVKSKKLNYLKAILNNYISLVNMLEEVEKVG